MSEWPTDEARAELALAALPASALRVLEAEGAPPRLVAHLTLVHDVALRLTTSVSKAWPTLAFDKSAVAFGAATHDVGKARHPSELSEPGRAHEAAGEQLLLEHAVAASHARFARTHGDEPASLGLEDVLVVLADTAWKGKRLRAVDDRFVALVAAAGKVPPWDVFLRLDSVLTHLAKDADKRLEWQARFRT